MRAVACAALALVLLGLPSNAAADLIDFEAFSDGEPLSSQIPGLTFTNAVVLTAGVSLNEFEIPPHSGVNAVLDSGGPLRIEFAIPIFGVGGFFTYGSPVVLTAFDSTGAVLGTASSLWSSNLALSGDPGSTPNEFLQLAFGNISALTVAGDPGGGSFVLDDLTIQAVPEPGISSLLLLGATALAVRRRRRLRRRPRFDSQL